MASTKLTDAQRVILAAAAARESGLVLPMPKSLGDNRGTLGIILKSLLTRELITERPIMPEEELWRDTPELGRTTLVISTEGLKLLGIDPIEHVVHESDGSLLVDETRETAITGRLGGSAEAANADVAAPSLPKAGSKLDALITALRRPDGATIAELTETTGWQANSVRGAISGNLKKKLNRRGLEGSRRARPSLPHRCGGVGMKRPTKEEVEREILALDTLDTKALKARWRVLYRQYPPPTFRPACFGSALPIGYWN